MRKSRILISIFSILTLIICFLFVSCGSTKVAKQAPIQQLILEGRYDEAKELFKTKTEINGKFKK